MADTIMTLPGKIGDALHQWPIVHHWTMQNHQPVTIWLDEASLKPLVPLFESQPWVGKGELKSGIEGYQCGGQPWHFGGITEEGKTIYHLGLRMFPQRQLTLECLENCKVPLQVDRKLLA